MSSAYEQLKLATDHLAYLEAKLPDCQKFLADAQALVRDPNPYLATGAAREQLTQTLTSAERLIEEHRQHVADAKSRIARLEHQVAVEVQWGLSWSEFFNLLQTYTDPYTVDKTPVEVYMLSSKEDAILQALGVPPLRELAAWWGTYNTVVTANGIALEKWPQTLPAPPEEPAGVWIKLEAGLGSSDGLVQALSRIVLHMLATARAVRDYQEWTAADNSRITN